ncbi:MAG: DUF4159 domain-containing protein [Gemmatimonadetes bacterium]|nr:DUF4159 domain-containing protein [Gemmatimonadota bacterium]NNM06922.1 DUF4159 domain-containing protein [Gemmatimonadota bacterium]
MNRAALVVALASAVGALGLAGGRSVPGDGRPERAGGGNALAPGSGTTIATVAPPLLQDENGPAYNGKFTYVRLRYGDSGSDLRNLGSRGYGRYRGRRGPTWAHDYPDAEVNFSKIVDATTFIDTYLGPGGGRVLSLDDPELFKYPIATIIEVGYWNPSDEDIVNLRAYLLKGGFLIVDDTRDERGFEFRNFFTHMRRALPEYQIQLVPDGHEIFNTFFSIPEPLKLAPPYGGWNTPPPVYLGIFKENDPENGRLMVMINGNQDLQEYWEYSDRGYYPIDLSNEAYKFGVNYLIYAFTH